MDFSTLFKVEPVLDVNVKLYKFYEVGQKKLTAVVTENECIILYYLNAQSDKLQKTLDTTYHDDPICCLCFEPTGSWFVVLCNSFINIIPYLPQFEPNGEYDKKWSHTEDTKLSLDSKINPTSVVWWLTKNVDNILIIGQKNGTITFYNLDSETIISKTEIPEPVTNLQICPDNSLDIIILIITGTRKHYRLYLEDRSSGYLWFKAPKTPNVVSNPSSSASPPASTKPPGVLREKSNFFSYIKQISTDKIALFSQKKSSSQDSEEIPQPRPEYPHKPEEYVLPHRKETEDWIFSVQYVDSSHLITAYQSKEAVVYVEAVGEEAPKHKLLPKLQKDECKQVLYSPKLLYIFHGNAIEVHSAYYSRVPVTGHHEPKFDTILWTGELSSEVMGAYLMSPKSPPVSASGWKEPTFICDLILPRFNLEPCLVITKTGISLVTTCCDPCEWLVRGIVSGGVGAERAAKGIGAPLSPLLRAASDLTLARGKLQPATYLYELSKSESDGWAARLGVFGKWKEVVAYRPRSQDNSVDLSNSALFMQTLATVLLKITEPDEKTHLDTKYPLTYKEIEEICLLASAGGLWDILTVYSVQSGMPKLLLSSLKYRKPLCRGALRCLLKNDLAVMSLLEDDFDYFHEFLKANVVNFDMILLKRLAIWLCPLRAEFRPIFRDFKQGLFSIYTKRYKQVISTFVSIISEFDKRTKTNALDYKSDVEIETFKEKYVPKRAVSCGLKFWAYVDSGRARIMQEDVEIRTEMYGRIMDVACGNNHILLLSENGVYACGANNLGQLGVGEIWPESGSECLTPYPVKRVWQSAVVSVAAGNFHSVCIDSKGTLYTWGWNVHGQLGIGNIYDQYEPQIVTALQNKTVIDASCGSCHTTILTKDGEVWVMGCNMFGQLGNGDRNKQSLPVKACLLTEPIVMIAAGHFHNLALTKQGKLYTWGASPQNVRAASVRAPQPTPSEKKSDAKSSIETKRDTKSLAELKRDLKAKVDARREKRKDVKSDSKSPSDGTKAPTVSTCVSNLNEPHLMPTLVETQHVKGKILQISAGWHHSLFWTNTGNIYAWGLNFEGQLGTGDRKAAVTPTEMKLPDSNEELANINKHKIDSGNSKALIKCGGDYTVFIDKNGHIFCTGLNPQESCGKKQEKVMLKMRNTGRMLPVPFVRDKSRFHYHKIGEITSNAEPDRETITPYKNPLENTDKFKNEQWSDEILYLLKSWLQIEMFSSNKKLAAKFSYYNRKYTNCLKSLLDDIKTDTEQHVPLYLKHTPMTEDENEFTKTMRIEQRNAALINTVKRRTKQIGLAILNDDEIPPFHVEGYSKIYCHCIEIDNSKIIKQHEVKKEADVDCKVVWASKAGFVFGKAMEIFPVGVRNWEKYIRITRDFFAEHDLPYDEMEDVLLKCMQSNPRVLGASMVFSEDCFVYNATFTPKFYFKLMNSLIDSKEKVAT